MKGHFMTFIQSIHCIGQESSNSACLFSGAQVKWIMCNSRAFFHNHSAVKWKSISHGGEGSAGGDFHKGSPMHAAAKKSAYSKRVTHSPWHSLQPTLSTNPESKTALPTNLLCSNCQAGFSVRHSPCLQRIDNPCKGTTVGS
jgi:hypothetical protein